MPKRLTSLVCAGIALAACSQPAPGGPGETATPAATSPNPAPAPDYSLSFSLAFDDATREKLASLGETVTVSASYYGEPTPAAAPKYADETPQVVDLGEEVATVGPIDQTVALSGKVVNTINIFTARTSGPDNLISCQLIEGDIAGLKAAGASSTCTLIYP
jgi:hypothetical protein